MKKSLKITLLTAGSILIAGVLIFFIALLSLGFDFTQASTQKFMKKNKIFDQPFKEIVIDGKGFDVNLLSTADNENKIIYEESEKVTFSIEITGDALIIRNDDARKWYDYVGFHKETTLTLFLSQSTSSALTDLTVTTQSGDITISRNITCENATLISQSGDIEYKGTTKNNLSLASQSGDIEMDGVTCENITAKTSSGEIEFSNVITRKTLSAQSASGDIELIGCDGGEIILKSSSGDIEGRFLSGKTFTVTSGSGTKRYPSDSTGESCTVTTASGDIHLTVVG